MAPPRGFLLLGEPVSLDLVNTRVRAGGVDVDLLDKPSALAAWLAAERDRLPWSGTVTRADLQAVRTLRDSIAVLLSARRAHASPPRRALDTVNAALATAGRASRITWSRQRPRVELRAAGSRRDTLLHALAMDAARLLTGPDAKLVRTCEHPDCVLQFLARNPRRRWCSASVCGNRARVARHYCRTRSHT